MSEYVRQTIRELVIDTPRGPLALRDCVVKGGYVAGTVGVIVDWNSDGRRHFSRALRRLGLTAREITRQCSAGMDAHGHPVLSAAFALTGPIAHIAEFIRHESVLRVSLLDGPAHVAGAKGQFHRLNPAN
ncbi:MAG: hypothetical protein ACJ8F7_02635 [Gemmataceae bacterium]